MVVGYRLRKDTERNKKKKCREYEKERKITKEI
jgi:hypothetical protein